MRFRASYFLAACLPVVAFAAPRYSTERKTGPVPFVILRDASAGVEATIAPTRGGELCGLKVRHAGNWHELLYRACDYSPVEGWRGKAPLLWPATGGTYREGDARGSQRGTYTIDGHKYQMPFHGFVQGMEWNLLRHTAQAEQASVKLSVRDTEETRRFYPFAFRLSVEYVLREGVLELRYAVESQKQNSQKMFFSIGNHITFRTPFSASGDGGAVRMRTPARLMLRKDANNFPNGETQAPPFRDEVMLGDFVANPAVSLGGYSEEPYVELADP
ncbi:MAG: hypothetical protein JNL98_06500, partial [Bryobacterales bacterium]|nr:hypothetical protein [Bryobacterales bacterium]